MNDLRHLNGPVRGVARSWLAAHSAVVAPRLLGLLLVRPEDDGSRTVVRIVETEAYREDDAASHSARGRTPRTEAMFGPPGHLYVYFTYGMHWCLNVSTEPEGTGSAVLLRAAVVLSGVEHVRARRGPRHAERDLLRGPARLASGLGVDGDWYGLDLLDPYAGLRLATDGWAPPEDEVVSGPRIGIRHAADRPWRFHLAEVPEVSRYVRHSRA